MPENAAQALTRATAVATRVKELIIFKLAIQEWSTLAKLGSFEYHGSKIVSNNKAEP
jgi:hypothetical protein